MTNAYPRAGVDTRDADLAVNALVKVLRTIDLGRASRVVVGTGHYASVLEIGANLGIAISTDGVGSKSIIAELTGRYDTIGRDCIGMNANDVICVGADPIAMVDYIAVEKADPDMLEALALGLKEGAELAGIEIPGGELAQLPELIRGHPTPRGFDLSGTCIGVVPLDEVITGQACTPGDTLIGLPSSGVHANGLTLARAAFDNGGFALTDTIGRLGGGTVGETLLEPTVIYVSAIRALLASSVNTRGLAHITSKGMLNLLRLKGSVGFEIDAPLPIPPIFELVSELERVSAAEMHEVFNMGCGFCCVVSPEDAALAEQILAARHPGTRRIGRVTGETGVVRLPTLDLIGDAGGFRFASNAQPEAQPA